MISEIPKMKFFCIEQVVVCAVTIRTWSYDPTDKTFYDQVAVLLFYILLRTDAALSRSRDCDDNDTGV
jgi:hypothetical protein